MVALVPAKYLKMTGILPFTAFSLQTKRVSTNHISLEGVVEIS